MPKAGDEIKINNLTHSGPRAEELYSGRDDLAKALLPLMLAQYEPPRAARETIEKVNEMFKIGGEAAVAAKEAKEAEAAAAMAEREAATKAAKAEAEEKRKQLVEEDIQATRALQHVPAAAAATEAPKRSWFSKRGGRKTRSTSRGGRKTRSTSRGGRKTRRRR